MQKAPANNGSGLTTHTILSEMLQISGRDFAPQNEEYHCVYKQCKVYLQTVAKWSLDTLDYG